MDRFDNPYRPGAGTAPPVLIGRDQLLDGFDLTVRRAMNGQPGKSCMPVGLRGVGKTVLLNRFLKIAEQAGMKVGFIEAPETGDFREVTACPSDPSPGRRRPRPRPTEATRGPGAPGGWRTAANARHRAGLTPRRRDSRPCPARGRGRSEAPDALPPLHGGAWPRSGSPAGCRSPSGPVRPG